MLLIPAIDLKDGKCVRLRQGRMDEATVFSDDPVEAARRWVEAGARRLHIVDLNGDRRGLADDAPAHRVRAQAPARAGDRRSLRRGGRPQEAPRAEDRPRVTDINMPIMDGLKLVKKVRSDSSHRDIPIVIITTEGAAEDRDRALALGANAYITKPIQTTQILDTVRRLLNF